MYNTDTPLVLGCTGHRPQKTPNYNYKKLYDLAVLYLKQYWPQEVISGAALGWDTAIAEAAIDLDISLELAIPFIGQQDKWSLEDKKKYTYLLYKTNKLTVVDELAKYNPKAVQGYASWKLMQRNKYIVDTLSQQPNKLLLSFFDIENKNGGTAQCVRYAETKDVVVINCWTSL